MSSSQNQNPYQQRKPSIPLLSIHLFSQIFIPKYNLLGTSNIVLNCQCLHLNLLQNDQSFGLMPWHLSCSKNRLIKKRSISSRRLFSPNCPVIFNKASNIFIGGKWKKLIIDSVTGKPFGLLHKQSYTIFFWGLTIRIFIK